MLALTSGAIRGRLGSRWTWTMPSAFLQATISSMNAFAREGVGLTIEKATALVSLSLG